jgi:hypothetical protein
MKDASFEYAQSLARTVNDANLSNPEAAYVFAEALSMYIIKIGMSEDDAQAFEFLDQFMQHLSAMIDATITIRRQEIN